MIRSNGSKIPRYLSGKGPVNNAWTEEKAAPAAIKNKNKKKANTTTSKNNNKKTCVAAINIKEKDSVVVATVKKN